MRWKETENMNYKYLFFVFSMLLTEKLFAPEWDEWGMRAWVNGEDPWQPGEYEEAQREQQRQKEHKAYMRAIEQKKQRTITDEDDGKDMWGMREWTGEHD